MGFMRIEVVILWIMRIGIRGSDTVDQKNMGSVTGDNESRGGDTGDDENKGSDTGGDENRCSEKSLRLHESCEQSQSHIQGPLFYLVSSSPESRTLFSIFLNSLMNIWIL